MLFVPQPGLLEEVVTFFEGIALHSLEICFSKMRKCFHCSGFPVCKCKTRLKREHTQKQDHQQGKRPDREQSLEDPKKKTKHQFRQAGVASRLYQIAQCGADAHVVAQLLTSRGIALLTDLLQRDALSVAHDFGFFMTPMMH